MPTVTLTYSPDELRELVSKALTTEGRVVSPDDVVFVTQAGFPGPDPRESHSPSLTEMVVKVRTA